MAPRANLPTPPEGGRLTDSTQEPEAAEATESDADSEEDAICAICFEHTPFVALPCACKIKYCAQCWDRALATSVSVRGRAQCPTCRSAFKIEFDVDTGNLVFSPDPEGTHACDWRSQLYVKVRNVQIRLLESYGKVVSGDLSPGRLATAPKSPKSGAGECNGRLPSCVCGAALEHISSRARILRMLEDTEPGWRSRVPQPEDLVLRLMNSSLVTCDLCDQIAISSGSVWTCQNGPHTVMHPAAYDVCDACFDRHSGIHFGPPQGCTQTAHAKKGLLSLPFIWEQRRRSAIGCCQACTAVLSVMPRPWRRRTQQVGPQQPTSSGMNGRRGGESTVA